VDDHAPTADGRIRLHPGKDITIRRGHPWVFEGAIAAVEGAPISGDVVEVVDSAGAFVAWAFYSAHSQIRARCVSYNAEAVPGEALLRQRLRHAWDLRLRLGFSASAGVRVVHAEGDMLPGLIIDLYDATASIQFHHPWAERYREMICSFALQELGARTAIDRSQRAARAREGLPQSQGLITDTYEEHPRITEHGVVFEVDARNGQKTGFYLDQRANRALMTRWASGRRVLDLYAHTGGFGLACLAAGAEHVTFVESGAAAVDVLGENLALNGIAPARCSVVREEVERFLGAASGGYDMVIMDPPPMARRKAHVSSALRGMVWQLAAIAKLAGSDTLLMAFSCSHHLGPKDLEGAIASAAVESGRTVQVLRELGADADHPSAAGHPEGRYLCGFLAHIGEAT